MWLSYYKDLIFGVCRKFSFEWMNKYCELFRDIILKIVLGGDIFIWFININNE